MSAWLGRSAAPWQAEAVNVVKVLLPVPLGAQVHNAAAPQAVLHPHLDAERQVDGPDSLKDVVVLCRVGHEPTAEDHKRLGLKRSADIEARARKFVL